MYVLTSEHAAFYHSICSAFLPFFLWRGAFAVIVLADSIIVLASSIYCIAIVSNFPCAMALFFSFMHILGDPSIVIMPILHRPAIFPK